MILVLTEIFHQQIKRTSLESLTLAAQLAKATGSKVKALCIGDGTPSVDLGDYGADEVVVINDSALLENDQLCDLICRTATRDNASYVILSLNSTGKSTAGLVAAKLNKGLISGVTGMNTDSGNPLFKKNVFSGKASAWYSVDQHGAVVATLPNGISPVSGQGKQTSLSTSNSECVTSKIKRLERRLQAGKTPLAEASVVVSAGRGMKDPSNWGMIEELSDILGATTACSRPVADAGWRPHHEHVGQTGLAIRPNVYVAIGISGAIQHLAGVNNSRKIIVINKDPEAPFFKAADYGVCGDLFEIVPKLNEALKNFKSKS
ncbi:MAG: electron transfer flavoprotein subunit alpha/FixB family protein [Saprospiraceae bacterium]|nr:electron transfer flavoprotein subunit alpha/FixB family protein [Saprospiraceae bacterium]HMW38629.1 electron transfer flavoprotein subunit alpha/FixB family protein [Saprospiraceae bacterium]HMX86892.1 electron transfer flavoprotein subunit alpha/FixB family protein [Saprospiraceae bacterium]HMZ39000.1 electron transfer flavoprotein subunit alpha/FixB family protein [Saprospiraceae bacterium]HNA64814.1 electron transfer flavoprotein subunit alpha/FixB family protein [Saprospiraceae bacteri